MDTHKISARFRMILIVFVILSSCSSSKHSSNVNKDQQPKIVDTGYQLVLEKNVNQSIASVHPNEKVPSNLSLADMLRKLPGVNVRGNGNFASVTIRGAESFTSGTEPLYVLNGVAVGTEYSQVASVINPNAITSLSVLKGSEAAIYGTRGSNGVILIRTK